MSVLRRTRNAPADPTTTPPQAPADPTPQAPADPLPASPTNRVPSTRTSAVWIAICTAALTFVVLIVFMLQNTRRVEVSFLWMHGSLPLALALLIAGVGSAILTMVVGTVRITQLRRLSRQRH
jgi:putative membrane protein